MGFFKPKAPKPLPVAKPEVTADEKAAMATKDAAAMATAERATRVGGASTTQAPAAPGAVNPPALIAGDLFLTSKRKPIA
jgi:hypothetical protein